MYLVFVFLQPPSSLLELNTLLVFHDLSYFFDSPYIYTICLSLNDFDIVCLNSFRNFVISNDTIYQPKCNYNQCCKHHNTTLYLACTWFFVFLQPPSSLLELNTLLVFHDLSYFFDSPYIYTICLSLNDFDIVCLNSFRNFVISTKFFFKLSVNKYTLF